MAGYFDSPWPRYVSVAERRRRAAKKIASMKRAGRTVAPVEIAGRKIVTTFWGEAWCKNLEAYSDFANRLPRGRTYVRNGSVLDLQIEAGRARALVSGSEFYTVEIAINTLPKDRWDQVKGRCAGQIGSLVELLRGSISKSVMEIVTRKGEGLFPSPREIGLKCSCPDWATMCKHVAATMYGVGARLDREPELLFTLRGLDPAEMVEAAIAQPTGNGRARKARVLEGAELSSIFGVDIDGGSEDVASTPGEQTGTKQRAPKTRNRAAPAARKKPAGKTGPKQAVAGKTSATRPATAKKRAAKITATQAANREAARAVREKQAKPSRRGKDK